MDSDKLLARRKAAGACATLVICVAILLLGDGMIAGGRKDPSVYELTPGQSLMLSDPMPKGAAALADLELRAPAGLSARLLENFSGFWLGGTLWRAEVSLPADIAPGDYAVAMHYAQNGTEAAPRQVYTLRVFKDGKAMQAAALSVTRRVLGVSPYLLAACMLPLAGLPMFASFRLSRSIGRALAAQGMAEIFRAMASPEGQRVFFTPPPGRALAEGDRVAVLDESGAKPLGQAVVQAVRAGHAEALMQDGAQVRPGALAKP